MTVLRARATDAQGNPVSGRTATLEPYGANRYQGSPSYGIRSRGLAATSGSDGWLTWTLPDPQRKPGPKGFYWVIKGLESAPVVAATQPGDATVTLDDRRIGSVSASGSLVDTRPDATDYETLVPVTRFGAKGDSSTDDTRAFIAALASGESIYVPPGTFMAESNALAMALDGQRIVGAGRELTFLKKLTDGLLLDTSGSSTGSRRRYVGLSDMTLHGNNHTGTLVRGYYVTALQMERILHYGNVGIGLDLVEAWDSTFFKVDWEWVSGRAGATDGSGHALRILSSAAASGFGSSTDSSNALRFLSCRVETFADGGIWINASATGVSNGGPPHDIQFSDLKVESSQTRGSFMHLGGAVDNVHVDRGYFYVGGMQAGLPAGTRITPIEWFAGTHTSLRNIHIGTGGDFVVQGIALWTNGSVTLDHVRGAYAVTPSSGAHVNITGGTPNLSARSVLTNRGAALSGVPTSWAPTMAPSQFSISAGDLTLPRELAIQSTVLTSGQLRLNYFTATRTENCTQIRTVTGGTAAAATPTLCRMGVYSVAANGDLTLVASTPNDTTLWNTTFAGFGRTTASWQKVAGQRYAVGMLIVTGAASPNLGGLQVMSGGELAPTIVAPRVTGALAGQTDLPASVPAASVGSAAGIIYAAVLP